MKMNVEFKTGEWDDCSETSMIHLSYIIQTLLPLRWIGWENGPGRKTYEKFLQDNSFNEEDIIKYIPTGSQAEGIGIPEAIRAGSISVQPEIFSDVDVLCVIKSMEFSTRELSKSSLQYHGYLDYAHTPPGYVRICLLTMPKNPDMVTYDVETNKNYFRSYNVSEYMFSNLTFTDSENKKDKYQQGPAMTITDHGKQSLNKVEIEPLNEISTDIVTAFKCTPWPHFASSLENRARNSEWLNSDLITSIFEDGCHVVGVPSKTSHKPDIEWRLSFSASEGRLAREAVTDHQRRCYIYLKILRYQAMNKGETALSSYMLKSIFLHCCEKLPVSYWKDYPGNCVIYMMDVLLECLQSKHVPTYFLPENNLISHLTNSDLQTAITVVQNLRCDLISPVLDFMDHRCLLLHPLLGSFKMMIQPVLDDMKHFKVHRDSLLSIKRGISQSISIICSLYLHENTTDGPEYIPLRKHQEAVKCLADVYTNWLHKVYPRDSLLSVVNTYGLSLKSLERSVRFFKAAVSLSEEYPEFNQCRGNLACMLHAYAYDKDGEVNDQYLKQADKLFGQVYKEDKTCVVDYATFLLNQNRYREAKEILEDFLQNCSDLFKNIYSYSAKEIKTVDDCMRIHIITYRSVTGEALSFVYYYIVKCLCALDIKDKSLTISKTLNKLQQHRNEIKTGCSFDFYEQAKINACI
ncbi:uncharacterized protein LOC132712717 [Ruditapes philippinarum]|uniref:uncharacterized protein LOC132712717 n=1 Tax=Ruditapes philippinarum TaxID=129788 RepID=UPI00295B4E5E|nr:uncharacterized protein LOC132712717 [Ruditapes philippinarum]XP_060551118.1 uncharacterized protein LOC132712717 [Ruditapes philippinarum]XP_060551120.1 uncharacterized protein LOC132712717 [Ruditapes philippinarum]